MRTNLEAVRESAAFPCTVALILRQQRVKGLAASQGFAWLPLSLSLSLSLSLGLSPPLPRRRLRTRTHPPPRHGQVQRGAEEQAPVEAGPQARRAWGARHRQAQAEDRARLHVRQAEAQARAPPQPGRSGDFLLWDVVYSCGGLASLMSLLVVSGVQEQKEAAMIKALENNIGDV